MSVTVVSALNKPSQASSVDSTPGKSTQDDKAEDVQGFAGLLLAQFTKPPQQSPGDLPITATPVVAADADQEVTVDDNNSALFATLGLVPSDQARSTEVRQPGEVNSTLSGVSQSDAEKAEASLKTSTAKSGRADLAVTDDSQSGKFQTVSAAKPAIDDKSAIIAASSLRQPPVTEASTPDHAVIAPAAGNLAAPASREASLAINTPVRESGWTSDFADKIVWLATNDKQSAKLTLNPAHMGPLEISLNIDKGHATASFVSANADVREALETALPRLREMFANAGISLGQTNVSAESFNQPSDNNAGGGGKAQWSSDNGILVGDSAGSMPLNGFGTQRGNGMVDTFA